MEFNFIIENYNKQIIFYTKKSTKDQLLHNINSYLKASQIIR